jgi:hypothetical protein
MLLFGRAATPTRRRSRRSMARALRAAGVDSRAIGSPAPATDSSTRPTAMSRTIAFLRTHLSRG